MGSIGGRIRTVIVGGLFAGLLDICYAFGIFWFRSHVSPVRIGQAIASHVLGASSFNGGLAAAALGIGLHFAIAVVMALVFYLICRMIPVVARNALVFAIPYGLALYGVMTYLVLPLTDPKHGPWPTFPPALDADFASAMFAHIVLVALPIAWFTQRALSEDEA
ncbi:MAG: hypothetical protein JF615_16275 [Asticcacaulis sp.]|nr:hypothetical protein [Asticcacaulis sp.]